MLRKYAGKAARVEIRPWVRVWTHEIEHAMYVMYVINVCMNQYSRPCCIGYTIRFVWLVWTKIHAVVVLSIQHERYCVNNL